MSEIFVVGISGNTFSDEHLKLLGKCYAVVCSKRLSFPLAGVVGNMIPVTPLDSMVKQVKAALQHGSVAVIASGDPLFYGVGRTLLKHFHADQLIFYPALSAMQLACARFKVPWDDALLLSLHGRKSGELAARILPHAKVLLCTDQRNTPNRIARILEKKLQDLGQKERLENIRIRVAEDLGLPTERITSGRLAEIAEKEFSPLNMVLVEQHLVEQSDGDFLFGLQEKEIVHSRGLITKDEVRAVILHCLRLPAHGVFWDVGGGSGSISVESARLCPQLRVFTVEQKPEGQENIQANIAGYSIYNVELISGRAPEILSQLPNPDRVFIGGSGGELAAIIGVCAQRLRSGGRIVVSAVLADTAKNAPRLLLEQGFTVDVRTISVFRHAGPDRAEQTLNPITIITGKK